MRIKLSTLVFSFLAVIAAPLAAHAGGPLFIDPETGQPFRYGPGMVRVYTDLGTLGILSNDDADAYVVNTCAQWTNVESSSFEAQVQGDFTAAGLPEINATNATTVIGPFNGGGIHVIYDNDGLILKNFLGAPSTVLGIAMPEWANEGTTEVTESWVVLNGKGASNATGANGMRGVVTHEFGHSIGLAHSQTNGAIVYYGDVKGPAGCTSVPYAGAPTFDDIETMYPVIQNSSAGGVAQASVDVRDDIVSISNLYPVPGWPENSASIAGTITDDKEQLTGVNVIARNVANPWKDAVSALSGDQTQGLFGPDGRYTFNGLTPGAEYVVYVDNIVVGGFSTPVTSIAPGLEEFYNGANESDNGLTDEACEATNILVRIGTTETADIVLNRVEDGPKLTVLGSNVQPISLSDDGRTVVGYITGGQGPAFRWSDREGFEMLGGIGGHVSISRDGSMITGDMLNPADNNRITGGMWQGGTSWMPLPGLSNFSGTIRSNAYSVTNGGTGVVGYGWTTINGVNRSRALRWDAETNTSVALEAPTTSTQARATGVSDDGTVVFGFHATPTYGSIRNGAIWFKGTFNALTATQMVNGVPTTRPVGEALNSNTDGSIVVGAAISWDGQLGKPFWRWTADEGVQLVAALPGYQTNVAFGVSRNGNVITGYGQGKQAPYGFDGGLREGFIWTPSLGLMPLKDFLGTQGLRIADGINLAAPISMSADGSRIIGSGYIFPLGSFYGWVLDIPNVRICHASGAGAAATRTIVVPFPDSMEEHLAHGDTLGPCACEGDVGGSGNGTGK